MPDSAPPPFDSWLGPLADAVRERLDALTASNFTARLWRRDPTLWKDDKAHQRVASSRLGWLGSVGLMQSVAGDLREFAARAKADGLVRTILLGMGGSSLCPEVFARVFGPAAGHGDLVVLDTTDPGAILNAEAGMDPASTLFVVSSKSGTTLETRSLYSHFRKRVEESGVEGPGSRFVAITDPGSPLEKLAREEGFRRCFANPPDIGGRYSALSYFGLVPAALLGMDLNRLLERASMMAAACGPGVLPSANPGVRLGAVLGEAARAGLDKLTFLMSPEVGALGWWIEQLVAESTGKEGRGILPVEGESRGEPRVYGRDRLVVCVRLAGGDNRSMDAHAASLREAAHPLVRIDLEDRHALGGEFLRWELATAVAGSILEVDPFDEPNVRESKDNTSRILEGGAEGGSLPEEEPFHVEGALELHAAAPLPGRLGEAAGRRGWGTGAAGLLAAFLSEATPPAYLSIQAWLEREPGNEGALAGMRAALRDALGLTVTVGYGPRFLHSTGQYHKGGPPRGHFLQVTSEKARDLPVPGARWTFGTLEAAQARGDLEALSGRGRPALRAHLRGETGPALVQLGDAIRRALDLLAGRKG